MSIYQNLLESINRETTLRTVALEEIYKTWKRSFNAKEIFDKAEKIHRHGMIAQFEYATQRMKISKKTVENQIQTATNTSKSSRKANKYYRGI